MMGYDFSEYRSILFRKKAYLCPDKLSINSAFFKTRCFPVCFKMLEKKRRVKIAFGGKKVEVN